MSLACKNLKVSFICKNNIDIKFAQQKYTIYKRRISTIIRQTDLGFVFTIYHHSPQTLHCTGIKHTHIIPKIIDFIKNVLKNETLSSCIDNSLFTCKQSTLISLTDVINKVDESGKNIWFKSNNSTIN